MGLSTVDIFKHIQSDKCICLNELQLKQLQGVMLAILGDIVSVCDEHHIVYTLGGGSALGAVRHHGFIPWDDDIDINMPREEFERFIPLFSEKYHDKYWIHTPENTKNFNLLLSRIRLKGTSLVTREDFFNEECGVFIDIFVIENTFDCKFLRAVHGFGSLAFGFLQSCRKFYRDRAPLRELAEGNPELKKAMKFKVTVGFFTSVLPMGAWTKLANSWNKLCRNNESKYVVIPSGRKHFFGEMYARKEICCTQKLTFEGLSVNCPANVDGYLRRLYGNYMEIPSDREKEMHVFLTPFRI